jgi:hypothetical protein
MLTIEAIRTAYALAATCSHGWAVALRNAGPAAREAAFRAAVERQDVEPLNTAHREQVAREQEEGMTSWVGVTATPEFSHTTGSGSLAWRVHPDGSATVSTGREVDVEVTAVPGQFLPIPGDGRLVAMLRLAANAVQTGECQMGMYRAARMEPPAPVVPFYYEDGTPGGLPSGDRWQ